MNKVLDFHRLAMVLRWDALSNWKKSVRNTLGMAFVFSFICIWYQFNMRSNGYVTYNDVKDLYLGSVSGLFMFISFIIFFFCGSRIFINMKTKASRSLFLMLPATIGLSATQINIFINTNFAGEAGLIPSKDAIIMEGKDSPYANVIAVREAEKDSPAIKALAKAANSPEVKEYIVKELEPKGIVPAF